MQVEGEGVVAGLAPAKGGVEALVDARVDFIAVRRGNQKIQDRACEIIKYISDTVKEVFCCGHCIRERISTLPIASNVFVSTLYLLAVLPE